MEAVIDIQRLRKVFRVHRKEKEGFFAAVASLVRRSHEEVVALDGLSMEVGAGEIRALIGPNGAGKSTTTKVLSGVLYPTTGTVNVLGYVPWKEREAYAREIGVVFGQKSQLVWELPPVDTYAINREMYRIPASQYRPNLDFFRDSFGIADIMQKPVRSLSLGERMKCELVCALLHDPPLIFLDEPTIGLDLLSREAIRNYIRTVNRERGVTVILTTHDLSDIENLCRTVTVINKGAVVFDGALDRLRSFVSERKHVEVKYCEPVAPARLAAHGARQTSPLSASLEIKVAGDNVKKAISRLLGDLPVADINVSPIPIEEVIKELYRR